jgi:phosphate starvation-inducible PhoH-like protein
MKHKKDMSPHVSQRDKLKGKLEIKPFNWTDKQKEFLNLALDKQTQVVFVSGPAGSSKTLLTTYTALELVNQRRVSDILYIRSAVESADSSIGYLPGEVDDKMAYYGIPFMDKLGELLSRESIEILKKEGRIEIQPVNFIRGQSWNARVIIVDEAQNMTAKEIYTILTRIGKFSKCFVLADPTQSDMHNGGSGFVPSARHFADKEGNENGVFYYEFGEDDIMRSNLVKFLVRRYKIMKEGEKPAPPTYPSGKV